MRKPLRCKHRSRLQTPPPKKLGKRTSKRVRWKGTLQTPDLSNTQLHDFWTHFPRLSTLAWIFIPLSFSASFFGMNVEQLNDSGPHIGYYFVLLLFSLIISALTTLLYTNWWERIAFAWRARIEPGHDCRPRELPLAYLLWITARWLFTEMTFGRIKTRMARRRTTNTTDIELHSA